MFEANQKIIDKIVEMSDIKQLRAIISQRLSIVSHTSDNKVTIEGSFSDGYNYTSDEEHCLERPEYLSKTLDSIRLSGGEIYQSYIRVLADESSIIINVKGNNQDWTDQTFLQISQLIHSWKNQDYSQGFLFKKSLVRIILNVIIAYSLNVILSFLAKSFLGATYRNNYLLFSLFILSIQLVSFFLLERNIPTFRKAWPLVEFNFGPYDQRKSTYRTKAVLPVISRTIWLSSTILIPIILFIVDKNS